VPVGRADQDEITGAQLLDADGQPMLPATGQDKKQLVEIPMRVKGRGRMPRAEPAERGVVRPTEREFAQLQYRAVEERPSHINRVQIPANQVIAGR